MSGQRLPLSGTASQGLAEGRRRICDVRSTARSVSARAVALVLPADKPTSMCGCAGGDGNGERSHASGLCAAAATSWTNSEKTAPAPMIATSFEFMGATVPVTRHPHRTHVTVRLSRHWRSAAWLLVIGPVKLFSARHRCAEVAGGRAFSKRDLQQVVRSLQIAIPTGEEVLALCCGGDLRNERSVGQTLHLQPYTLEVMECGNARVMTLLVDAPQPLSEV